MIGKTILHYEIIEKTCLPLGTIGEGGLVRPSWLGQAETGRSHNNFIGEEL